jgi:CRP/FNR family cyclic AMP-dependent transcriptional regulator
MSTNQVSSASKSGVKTLSPGQVLFSDGDLADSLYIIQKGQVRLYKPKGNGFIELSVLRVGEVIGEMAYFDEDGSGRKRSCSAAAITPVEIIEISFIAFGKTMQSLNPWFKTIINTLVVRLRKTNLRVKELEDNHGSVNYGTKSGSYEFMKPIEVMRVLGTLFLVFKAHGEFKHQSLAITRKTLLLYTQDMYRISESKIESIINILIVLGLMEIQEDEENLPNLLLIKNIEIVRYIFIYYIGERNLLEEKKMKVGEKCELLLSTMIQYAPSIPLIDIPNLKVIDGAAPKFTKYFNLSSIVSEFKNGHASNITDLVEEGKNIGLLGDVVTMDGQLMVECDLSKIKKLFPVIRFMNLIKKLNAEKVNPDAYIPVGR